MTSTIKKMPVKLLTKMPIYCSACKRCGGALTIELGTHDVVCINCGARSFVKK